MLQNTSAESGTLPDADFWVNEFGTADVIEDALEARTGNRVWKLISADPGNNICSVGQLPVVAAGEKFTVKAWVRIPNASPTRQVNVRQRWGFFLPAGGFDPAAANGQADYYIDNPNWNLIEGPEITCPADGDRLVARIYVRNQYRDTYGGPDIVDTGNNNFPAYVDDLTAESPDYTFATVSGTITDGGSPVSGVVVTANQTSPVTSTASAPSDGSGNYSLSCRVGKEQTLAASSLPAGKMVGTGPAPFTPPDTTPITGKDFTLTNDPDYDPDLLFFARSSAASASAPWACVFPAGTFLGRMGSPGVETVGSQQWEKNVYGTGDGYRFGGTYSTPIAVSGASVIAVVKPQYLADGGWGCVFNAFYNDLSLNVNQRDGRISVFRKGFGQDGPNLLDGQKAVLSLVVQPDGQYKLYINGTESMTNTDPRSFTQLSPGGWNWNNEVPGGFGFANNINVGRNEPDGWSTYNGLIGDVAVYKVALDDTKRAGIESGLMTKFGIGNATFTIDASVTGSGGTIDPSGSVSALQDTNKTFTINRDFGYAIADVLVDGVSVGPVSSYTFNNINDNHTIVASFSPLTVYTITATAGTGGTLSPNGSVLVEQNTNKTFNITTNYGYALNDVVVDGVSQGPVTSYTFTDVTDNHTIDVSWTALPLISGTVTDSTTTNPIYSATVTISTNLDGSAPIETMLTDFSGQYQVAPPDPNATYYLIARKGGHVTSAVKVVAMSGSSKPNEDFVLVKSATLDPLVALYTSGLSEGLLTSWTNVGSLGGTFDSIDGTHAPTVVADIAGKKAVQFVQDASGEQRKTLLGSVYTPRQIAGNSDWSLSTVIYRAPDQPGGENCYMCWSGRDIGGWPASQYRAAQFSYVDNLAAVHYGADYGYNPMPSSGEWHTVTITYDGETERLYVDGVEQSNRDWTLNFKSNTMMLIGGAYWDGNNSATPTQNRYEDQYWRFNGAIASLQIFDQALTAQEVANIDTGGVDPNDTDGDGIPDTYEMATVGDLTSLSATGDFDKDGTPDRAEWKLGLLPNNPASLFVATVTNDPATGDVTLTWPSQLGCKFNVLWTDDLSQPMGSWTALGGVIEDLDGGTTESYVDLGISNDPGYPSGYYVVVLTN